MSLTHAANPGRHSIAARKDDLYETPPEAVRALLRVESLPEAVWESTCGPGSVVRILREAGPPRLCHRSRRLRLPRFRERCRFPNGAG